ncbi:RHS repeat-associated core domain-containing protein [Actinokineospora auranticolor]|uniref:RHS repeat domain-containing protein n=1 Tax=Actinokineospora auranticolor TaxID=155976 RepID=UPI0015E43440|nr:RHS repeat-associated core domain-containing protein [Actinokineospora auranticolor]
MSTGVDAGPPSATAEKVLPHTEYQPPKRNVEPPTAPAPERPLATAWPVAGEATVAASARGRVPGLPVTLSARGTVAGSFHVQVADQELSTRAGVAGVVVSVTPDTSTGGEVAVGMDYSGFHEAIGGDYGSRLRLAALPACVLDTPEQPRCQVQTPLPSSNDATGQVVGATVALSTDQVEEVVGLRAPTRGAPVVLAVVADAAGPSGDYEASSLKPSGRWSVTGSTGAFTWDYPIEVPPVAAGELAPKISLGYNSAAVDGLTAATNNQASWAGSGWGYSPGSIERVYRACADDKTLPAAQQTGDYCWAGHVVSLNLGEMSAELVRDDATGTWHASNDNGARVELLTGATNGAYNGEYWKITNTDGVAYYFGLHSLPGRTSQEVTDSTWTVPVYHRKSGDPCQAAGKCDMAWRWNLDYVKDPHGNASAYYYSPEYNYYGADKQTTGVRYTRAGSLRRVDYGLREIGGSIYSATPPNSVAFDVAERCVPGGAITCDPAQRTTATATSWPDVPTDQECKQGAVCNNHGPSFWSTKRLSAITTRIDKGAGPVPVDRYEPTFDYPTVGDRSLQLRGITHTAYGSGTQITAPPISFAGQLMPNRVQGYNNMPTLAHWRLTNINTDAGSAVVVTYRTGCTATDVPSDPANNTKLCYPVYWTPEGVQNPVLDYFHKYVVESVRVDDRNELSPGQLTEYAYLGAPAWHYDDNELVKPENRTYGQFRGFQQVEVRTGDVANRIDSLPVDRRTLVRTTYYRGMDGDRLPNGGTRTMTVSNSLGETVPDNPLFVDTEYEVRTFDGESGPWTTTKVTEPVLVATTGSRARPGLNPLVATIVKENRTRTVTNLAAGGTKTLTTTNRYDTTGRVEATTESGTGVVDVCTTTKYADNTVSWIRDKPREILSSEQVCPPSGVAQTGVFKGSRTYYDGQLSLGAVPGAGNATRSDTVTSVNAGVPVFATTSTATYDASGRTLSTTDGLNRTVALEYTPADGGLHTKTVKTNGKNQKSTEEFEPSRGKRVVAVDEGGRRADLEYDAVGRLTAVWKPGQQPKASNQATLVYEYLVRTDGPLAVTNKRLVDTGTAQEYVTEVKLFDAFGQLRQSQVEARDGLRVVNEAFYDSHGWKRLTNNRYLIQGAPSTNLVGVASSEVDDRTLTDYDGTGRVVREAAYKGDQQTWFTSTIYGGDRKTVVPPTGGVTSTALTDVRGNNVEARQYTAAPTITGDVVSGGTFQATKYEFNAAGKQNKVTDPAGVVWTFEYDPIGQLTKQVDPDSGQTTTTYDLAGQVTSTTDGRGQVLTYDYDALGRKTAAYAGAGPTRAPLASWTFDGATNGVGKPYTSTRYTADGKFESAYTAYDTSGNPNKIVTKIPASQGTLGSTYTTQYAYSSTGLTTMMQPHAAGGLPGEAIVIGYDKFSKPRTMTGYNAYVSASTYTPYDEASQLTLGPSNNKAWLSYGYDAQTRRLTNVNLSAQQASAQQVDDVRYYYDAAGNRTRTVNTRGPAGSPVRTECYRYDQLDRLSDAWTATDDCAAAPSSATVGGPNPYWKSWSFLVGGSRDNQTEHGVGGAANKVTNYAYPAAGAAKPHSLSGTTTGSASTSYAYDGSGNTTQRTSGSGQETLTWNEENKLSTVVGSAGTTSYVYDADGKQLLRRDPTSATLYLPGQELKRDNATGIVTGTRYYTFGEVTVALRVANADPKYVVSDPHATATVTLAMTGFAVTRRDLDPYGNEIGSGQGTWPHQRGFLNMPVSSTTGLVDVGAREYDPVLGRFLSVDPVLDSGNPQQMTGYSYGGDNPLTNSDPSGEFFGLVNFFMTLYSRVVNIVRTLALREKARSHFDIPANAETWHRKDYGVRDMFLDWYLSDQKINTPRVYLHQDGDRITEDWKQTSAAKHVQDMIRDEMKFGVYGPGGNEYQPYKSLRHTVETDPFFNFLRMGADGWSIATAVDGWESADDIEHFMGSFTVDYQVMDVKDDHATVKVIASNKVSFASATRNPITGEQGGFAGIINGGLDAVGLPKMDHQADHYQFIETTMQIPCAAEEMYAPDNSMTYYIGTQRVC